MPINRRTLAEMSAGHGKNAYILEPLKHRELIRVSGKEALPFLQGLVTTDVSNLQDPDTDPSIYGFFLNRGGRVLYDTIIYRTSDPDTFLLECDREASSEFRRHLRTYRVRKRIDVDSVDDEYTPWVIFNENNNEPVQCTTLAPELFVSPDPRIKSLGSRVLAPTGISWNQLAKSFWHNNDFIAKAATPESNYKLLRYKQGVGEGISELPPAKCFPLEANADFLNGVSFSKGCYVGQELTARVHHSGVIRKRYMPIRLSAPLNSYTVTSLTGANLGRVFGHSQGRGVALLRVEQALNSDLEMVLDGERCYAERPTWWPNNMSNRRRLTSVE